MSTFSTPSRVTHAAGPAGATGSAPAPVRRGPRTAGVVVAALAVLAAIAVTAWSQLNGDVTYAFGGMETAGKGGVSVWDVFVARPLAYRLLFSALDAGRALFVGDGSLTASHVLIRAETDLLIAAVAAVLFLGVRRFLGVRAAATVAVATGLALIVSPPWHFLEPDWVAVLVAALAVGAACAPRPVWAGALLGGFAAFLAVAVKLATAPVSLLALLLVALLSLRRAAWAAVATGGFTVLWYVATKHFLPWEWTWLNDQARLVENSPIHHGLRLADIHHLLAGTANVAVLSPIVVVAPAAAGALIRRQQPGRPRWIGAAAAVVAAGLSVASAYGQGEYFMYHFAVVPVLAAGVCGVAFALCPSARIPLVVTTVIVAGASLVLLRQPAPWRLAHAFPVELAYAVAGAVAAGAVWVAAGRTTRSAPSSVGAVALSAALVLATLPGAPYALSTYDYTVANRSPADSGYAALRARIGPDTPVLYLTFGSINYLLGNPTACRYPSPQWLQRASNFPRVRAYPSYADNVRCLTDDGQARYLVWQSAWFSVKKASPQVQSLLDARFDCAPAARIPAPSGIIVCPARA